jgi:dUTP pyrophosphatase
VIQKIPATVAPGGALPSYKTTGSAGADLCALLDSAITVEPGQRAIIPTGVRLEIPPGYEGQVRPRSGLAARHGVTVLNTPGTIDSDYRGEIKVILVNLGSEPYVVSGGTRIAQLIIAPVIQAEFTLVPTLSGSERGEGGFGSTGS